MLRTILSIVLSGFLAACAGSPPGAPAPTPTPDEPGVPKVLLPNKGKSASRAAGLGNAAPFAP